MECGYTSIIKTVDGQQNNPLIPIHPKVEWWKVYLTHIQWLTMDQTQPTRVSPWVTLLNHRLNNILWSNCLWIISRRCNFGYQLRELRNVYDIEFGICQVVLFPVIFFLEGERERDELFEEIKSRVSVCKKRDGRRREEASNDAEFVRGSIRRRRRGRWGRFRKWCESSSTRIYHCKITFYL